MGRVFGKEEEYIAKADRGVRQMWRGGIHVYQEAHQPRVSVDVKARSQTRKGGRRGRNGEERR